MNKPSQSYWLKSGLFSIFEKGSVFVFGFGATLILLRYLTVEQFGAWTIFLAITSIVEVSLVGLNMNALIKFSSTAKDKTEYKNIQTSSLSLNILLTLISISILFSISAPLGTYFNSEELKTMLRVYCLTSLCLIPFFHLNFTQQANLDFKGVFWSNFTRKGVFFLIVFALLFITEKQPLTLLAIIQLVGAIIASLVSYLCGKKYLSFARKPNKEWIAKLFHYSKYTFGTNLSTMLYKTIDKFMLGGMIGNAAAGIYQAAIQITNLVEVPSFSVAAIVFPQSARESEKDGTDGLRLLYEKSVGAILALILPFIVFVFLFPKFVILIVAGEQYLESVNILRLTILYGLFIPYAIQFGTVLDAMGKPKINFYFTLAGAFINIFFNWLFISKFGVIGAAYGTLTTYIITFIYYQIVLNKILGVKMYRPFRHIFSFYKQGFDIVKKVLNGGNIHSKAEI